MIKSLDQKSAILGDFISQALGLPDAPICYRHIQTFTVKVLIESYSNTLQLPLAIYCHTNYICNCDNPWILQLVQSCLMVIHASPNTKPMLQFIKSLPLYPINMIFECL